MAERCDAFPGRLLMLALFLGGAVCVSQSSPRVELLLQHRAPDIPLPANLWGCSTIAGIPVPTGEPEHPGSDIPCDPVA